jgi:hypothetical protein
VFGKTQKKLQNGTCLIQAKDKNDKVLIKESIGRKLGGWRLVSAKESISSRDGSAIRQDKEIKERTKKEKWYLDAKNYPDEDIVDMGKLFFSPSKFIIQKVEKETGVVIIKFLK